MKKGSGFEKFFKNKEKSGAAKKEAIRKEKRDLRKEREEGIANTKRQKRAAAKPSGAPPKYNLEPPTGRFQKKDGPSKNKPGFKVEKRDNRFSNDRPSADRRPAENRGENRFDKKSAPSTDRNKKPSFQKPNRQGTDRPFNGSPSARRDAPAKPFANDRRQTGGNKPTFGSRGSDEGRSNKVNRPDVPRPAPAERGFHKPKPKDGPTAAGKQRLTATPKAPVSASPTDLMPLNKYIAHSGICSRRDAVELIKAGKVKVNGELVLEPGQKVQLSDDVKVSGRRLTPVKDFIYVLLNKPKDYITTTDDPQERRTVLDLLKGVPEEVRIYPVGRLDRNTSGVLLLTNDGDLSQKLTHPSNEIKKVYAVTLDKPLTRAHFDDILRGIELEDGPANVDSLAYTDTKDLSQVGVELHSGRNRIVRRIFEHLGYDVKMLDRVMFAGLTKKNVNRGKWRYLNEREVRDLKFFRKGR